MVSVGDIVSVRQFPGERWVVVGRLDNGLPPERRWRVQRPGKVRRRNRPRGRVAGDGDITVLDHPQFSAGQTVRYFGEEAEIVRDDGETVRIRYRRFRPGSLDREDRTRTEQLCETDVGRGALVAHNLEGME